MRADGADGVDPEHQLGREVAVHHIHVKAVDVPVENLERPLEVELVGRPE